MIFGQEKMDHPPSPVLVSKLSRSLQARKRKQKSHVVKNKSCNQLEKVIEKIEDNNDIITNTVKEIENCLQIVKSAESQFTINDAEILNNNLDSRMNTLQEIQSVINRENDIIDISLTVQNNVLNYVQSLKTHKEEDNKNNSFNVRNIASTSKETLRHVTKNSNLLSRKVLNRNNSVSVENDIRLDDCVSDQDLLDDGNDSRISNLVNTIISGTKVYSSTPVQVKFEKTSKLNTSYRPKSLNISENSLKSASRLFEDILESPIIETSKTEFRKNFYKKSLNFTESEMDDDCFYSDITDTQMNQIVDEAIVITKSEKLDVDSFNGFESNYINISQEAKENWDSHLNQWRREFIDLSENSKLDFKGFHKVENNHKILDTINLEIERLTNSLPKINNLKRFQKDELILDKHIKKYRFDSDTSNVNVINSEFHSASNKLIEIKNLSKATNLFNDLDDYKILLTDNTKPIKKVSKIPLKSHSNIGELEFSKIKSKLNRNEKHALTLQNLNEMEKSFKIAETVFTFNTDFHNKIKRIDNSKAFVEFHESFNNINKDKGKAFYKPIDQESNNDNLGIRSTFNKQAGKNIDESYSENSSKQPSEEICFKTASNKKCKINEDVLRNVDILFKDINDFPTDGSSKTVNTTSTIDTLKEINFTISNSSSINSINSVKSNNSLPTFLVDKENAFGNSQFGFQTASDKAIQTNDKSVKIAQMLFKDLDSNESTTVSNYSRENERLQKSGSCNSFGFQTASDKAIKTNDKSLKTAQMLFKDLETNETTNVSNYSREIERIQKSEGCNNSDFQTASDKAIKTNEKSVKTAQMLFKDLDSNESTTESIYSRENDRLKKSGNNFGFSTASNKKLEAKNKEALEKAENIFKDLDSDINAYVGPKRNISKTSCNIIKTDEKSVEIAQKLFKDIENDSKNITSEETSINVFHKENSFKKPNNNFGFSTASNKTLKVLKENALENAENLFKDIDENLHEGKQSKLSSFSGNTKVDSMSKACNLFKDIFEEFSDEISDKNDPELNVNLSKSSTIDKREKQCSKYGTNIEENKEIYDELENAVMCFENMDETMLKIPTEDQKLNWQENKKMEQILENDNELFLEQNPTEDLDKMSSKFSTDDKKSEYSDADETLIEDTDDFTDAGSVGSKSDLDNVVLWKDIIKSKQLEFNIDEILSKPGFSAKLSNQNYLNEPCISLHQPTSGDLKQLDTEVKKQIADLTMAISFLEKKKTHIENLMNSNSKNQSVSFIPGKLFMEKQKNRDRRISLKDAVNNHLPCCTNIITSSTTRRLSISLWDITPENACDLHFYLPSPPCSFIITLTDDVKLMPSNLNLAGLTEFKIAFETMTSVDKQKCIEGWFENHFRWIVWKLASMDRQFPNQFDGYFLTPDNIMQQLKYRYDRDIYGNERSAIRKITERDDVPSRRMVLFVSKIVESSSNNYELELCDGWYSMKANIDLCLLNFIRKKKIQVGTKLITYGAELINVSDPCHPLQVQLGARLKIYANSTRRVKWDTKLGFQRITGPFRTSVQSILPNGGYVGRILGFIARSFPLKFIEKMSNEQWVCRCKRAESRRDRTFQSEQEKIIEKAQQEAYETLQNQWREESVSIVKEYKNSSDIQKLTCPKKLLALLEFSTDPSSISELLSKSQLEFVTDYRSKVNSQRQADISSKVQNILNKRGFAKRTVSSVLQLIIVDANKPDLKNHFMIEIWNPDNYVLDNLTEYSTVDFLNLISSNVRNENSLKATKQTRYLKVDQQTNINYNICLRYYTPIRQMQLIDYNPPVKFCDTVGVIVKICSEDNLIRFVWLADAHFRLLRIVYKVDSNNCLAFEGFNVGDIVAVFNLKLSKCLLGQAQALIDFVTYVTKTPSKSPDMTVAIEYLHNELPSSFNDFICDCDDKIAEWNNEINLR